MTKKCIFSELCLCLIVLSSGCASIVSGRNQEVTFQSNPDEAIIKVDGRIIGKTPLTVNMKKKSGQNIVFEKDGYKPLTMSLETRMNGWFWGNIVLGGVWGSTTDGVTGAVYEYSPSQYMASLQHSAANSIDAAGQKNQAERVKDFVVIGYNSLRVDIKNGSGPYLSSLLELLQIPENNCAGAIQTIQTLCDKYPNIVEFASQINTAFPETE